jgi:hypothetical protein
VAVVAGIDEAGYGPLLGPLVVSCAAFRVGGVAPGAPPDLWERIGEATVSRVPPQAARGRRAAAPLDERLTVCDSKKVYLGGRGLARMEESVLATLALAAPALGERLLEGGATLRALLRASGHDEETLERYPWFRGRDLALPHAGYRSVLRRRVDALGGALERAGVEALLLAPRVVHPLEFNGGVRRDGNKHLFEWGIVGAFLEALFERHGEEGVDVTCDKLGGRDFYGPPLARLFPDARVTAPLESSERSVYKVARGARRMVVRFLVEGDDKSFPVALASCSSKYARELFMALMNRFFQERMPGLKETAGYAQDGRRFALEVRDEIRRLEVDEELLVRRS